MKKALLFISLLFCIGQAFAGGNAYVQKQPGISSFQNELYSINAVNYPHTEFEVNYHTLSISSNCRQQSVHGFPDAVVAMPYQLHHASVNITENFLQAWCKQYLFHIYPSHNFW